MIFLAAPLLALAPAAPCGEFDDDDIDGIRWVESKLDVALGRALDRNIPLVIFACIAEEEHNEEFRENLGYNTRLGAGLLDAIPMYASNGEPPPGAELVRHKDLMNEVFNRWVAEATPDGDWKLPEVLFISPQGEVLKKIGSGHGPGDDEVLRSLAEIQEKLGDSVTEAELIELEALRTVSRKAHERQDVIGSWRAWRQILAITPDGPFAAEAARLIEDAEKALRKQLDGVTEGLTAANLADRYALAREIVRRSDGLELEKPGKAAVKALERDKRFRAEVKILDRIEDAEDLFAEVEAYLREGESKKADRALKKLVAKKFEDTPAYERAKERYASRLER